MMLGIALWCCAHTFTIFGYVHSQELPCIFLHNLTVTMKSFVKEFNSPLTARSPPRCGETENSQE